LFKRLLSGYLTGTGAQLLDLDAVDLLYKIRESAT